VYALLLSGILCRWIPASEIDDALTELLRLDPGGPDWRNLEQVHSAAPPSCASAHRTIATASLQWASSFGAFPRATYVRAPPDPAVCRWNDPGVPELFKKVGNLAPNDKLLLLAAWRAAAPIPGVMHHLCASAPRCHRPWHTAHRAAGTLFAWMPRPSQLCTSGPMEWCVCLPYPHWQCAHPTSRCKDAYSLCYRDFTKGLKVPPPQRCCAAGS